MSAAVLGHWEIGYHAPVTEAYYWNLPLRDFGVREWHMVPVSGIRNNEARAVDLIEHPDYASFFAGDDRPRVFVEPRSRQTPDTTWLHDFAHPDDCVYVFGSAHYNPAMQHARAGDVIVSIQTERNDGVLWANQALVIVLYDRRMKR